MPKYDFVATAENTRTHGGNRFTGDVTADSPLEAARDVADAVDRVGTHKTDQVIIDGHLAYDPQRDERG